MIESVPFWLAAALVLVAAFLAEASWLRCRSARRQADTLRADLDAALAELEQSGRIRSELLSRIGQSLRKPLESIKTATEEMTRPLECPDWMKDQLLLLTREIDNISKFIDLIGEIVALDRMKSESSSPLLSKEEVVDLEKLLSETVQEASGRLAERGISLAVAMDRAVRVRGDAGYLRQAMDSLVQETERFAGRGSIVHVDLCSEESIARITLDFRGPGDPDAASSVLSLELARQILAGHGGWLQEGARNGQFTVEIPVASEIPGAGTEEGDEQVDLQEV